MNKEQTIEAAKNAGVVRTEKQFETMSKGDIQALIEAYNEMTPEEKEAANKAAEEVEGAKAEKKETKSTAKAEIEEKLQKGLKDIWKNYPEVKEVYSTTDGTIFFKNSLAKNHQVSALKGKAENVKTHERD